MIGMVRNFLPSQLLPLPPDRPRRSHNCGQFFVAWCILVCRQITKKQQMKTMSHLDFYQISLLGHCTISPPRLTCLYMLDWSKIKSFLKCNRDKNATKRRIPKRYDLLLKIVMMQNLVHDGVYYAGFMKLPKASLSIN